MLIAIKIIFQLSLSYHSMMEVIKIAFIIIGAKIGAGFASGKEIFEYFAKYGINSLLFIPLLFVSFFIFTYILLSFGGKNKKYNLKQYNVILANNNKIFGKTFNIFNLFMIITFFILSSAMFSGLISLFQTYLPSIPKLPIYLSVLFITYILIKTSFSAISKISYIIVPLIIICIIINMTFTINPENFTTSVGVANVINLAPLSILYASQNTFLASFIIIKSGKDLNKKQMKQVSLLVSFILCSLIILGIICFLFNPALSHYDIPFAYISKEVGIIFGYLFGFIIFGSIITTYATTLTSLKEYFKNLKFGFLIMLTIICSLSLINFSNIIEYLYPVIGVFGFIYIYKAFQKCDLSFNFFTRNSNNKIHNTR